MTTKFRCVAQYDGTAFAGWQRQPGRMTVQGAVESALARVTGKAISVVAAGRTDTGVHALGQVIHFTCDTSLSAATLQRAVNALLPVEVSVSGLVEAADDFHARYSAISREYRYVVDNGEVSSPLLAKRVHHVPQPLAVDGMAAAAADLHGHHDFAAFGSPMEHTAPDPNGNPVSRRGGTERTLLLAACRRVRRFVLFYFVADAFLRHMVRMLVGTLLRVGSGSLPIPAIAALLRGDRSFAAGPAAPAHGLYLVRVRY
ncbi:MAG TPA: tRNA pseudouridine(38-40) synthase TruA [Chloroflexota bacterium]|nr:tRNA pseudouridine(38-40) synthase TruA [Chloroflexota bacterium]